MQIRYHITDNGDKPVIQWLDGLRDRVARANIALRIARLELNLFGDTRSVGDGIWELKIDLGPGYRVYYAQSGKDMVLLLCGGDKRNQKRDIRTAKEYWQEWKNQNEKEKDVEPKKPKKRR
jgi:putative addiction module killer protein